MMNKKMDIINYATPGQNCIQTRIQNHNLHTYIMCEKGNYNTRCIGGTARLYLLKKKKKKNDSWVKQEKKAFTVWIHTVTYCRESREQNWLCSLGGRNAVTLSPVKYNSNTSQLQAPVSTCMWNRADCALKRVMSLSQWVWTDKTKLGDIIFLRNLLKERLFKAVHLRKIFRTDDLLSNVTMLT